MEFGTHYYIRRGAISCAVPPRIYYFYWVLKLCVCQTLQHFAPEKFVTQTQRDDAFGARWATQMYKILRIVQFL